MEKAVKIETGSQKRQNMSIHLRLGAGKKTRQILSAW